MRDFAPAPRRRPRARYRLGAAILLAATLVGLALRSPDPLAVLREQAPTLLGVQREAAPELGPRVERWRIAVASGDTHTALWRPAPASEAKPCTFVLLGGLRTGDRAALLVPDSLGVHVLAVDWPWRGPRAMSPAQLLRSLPAIRRAILRSPGALALGVELAAREPGVDPNRIVLVGASLGAPPAVAALRLVSAPRACALVHGAADLESMFQHALREHVPGPLVSPAAALAARWIRPLEPRLHAPSLQAVPFLIINAADDEKLPPRAIAALHQAFPHADVRWESGRHLRPERSALIAALSREVVDWVESLDATPGARAATLDPSRGSPERLDGEESRMPEPSLERATLAGGCFWCLEAVYLELGGVESVQSGYAGGHVPNPTYEQVCSGRTGHAEVVQIEFDPATITFRELLEVFFTIHDPTTLNRQGADVGTQYRSAIFYHSPEQKTAALQVMAETAASGIWEDPLVTKLVPLETFYPAEEYHQDYFRRNPSQPYCRAVVAPKVAKARAKFFEKLKR